MFLLYTIPFSHFYLLKIKLTTYIPFQNTVNVIINYLSVSDPTSIPKHKNCIAKLVVKPTVVFDFRYLNNSFIFHCSTISCRAFALLLNLNLLKY